MPKPKRRSYQEIGALLRAGRTFKIHTKAERKDVYEIAKAFELDITTKQETDGGYVVFRTPRP